jgi:UDP-glucose 4-epimerase
VIIDNLSNSNENVLDGIEKITGIRPAFEKVDCCDYEALEGIFKKYETDDFGDWWYWLYRKPYNS